MKALWIILFVVAWGCRTPSPVPQDNKTLRTLSTTAMIHDIVQEIGGERIVSNVLIQGTIDPHSYELVKGDDEKIDAADIVFFNGLNLEHGASLCYKLQSHPHAVAVGNYLLQEHAESILYENGELDPHIWMDISLWANIIHPITQALSQKDPEGAAYYEERAHNIKNAMLSKHQELQSRLQAIPQEKRYLVTSHDAFGYFTRAYLAQEEEKHDNSWRKRFAAPEGLAPDGQLSVLDLKKIVDYLTQYHVSVVFPESNVSVDSLKKIVFACDKKHLPIRFSPTALYGDCMGEGETYLDMITHNGLTLIQEWGLEPTKGTHVPVQP